jgi:peroxiredoxin
MLKHSRKQVIVTACAAAFLTAPGAFPEIETNAIAPAFEVESGDGRSFNLEMTRGKTTLLFYETKETVEKNRALKNEIRKFYDSLNEREKQATIRLAVVDATDAAWPFTKIWRNKLVENSEKEGIIIYGDWDGGMQRAYKMKTNDSNFVIISENGRIEAALSGEIKREHLDMIMRMLRASTSGVKNQQGGFN